MPSVNHVEFHPFLYQERLLEFCKNNNIQLEAYSPLTRDQSLNHHIVVRMAKKYGITPAQILIRWNLQHGLIMIPKSKNKDGIKENSQVFNFQLEEEDMKLLNSMRICIQYSFDISKEHFGNHLFFIR